MLLTHEYLSHLSTICTFGNFSCFCCRLLTAFKINFFKKKSFGNPIRVSNSLVKTSLLARKELNMHTQFNSGARDLFFWCEHPPTSIQYCKSGNFRENFIFAAGHLCDRYQNLMCRCNSLSCPPGQLAPRGASCPGISCPPPWLSSPPGASCPGRFILPPRQHK